LLKAPLRLEREAKSGRGYGGKIINFTLRLFYEYADSVSFIPEVSNSAIYPFSVDLGLLW
jgi:hypothetical protein